MKKSIRGVLSIALIVTMLVSLSLVSMVTAAPATFTLDSDGVVTDGKVAVTVTINSINGLKGLSYVLLFDTAVLSADTATHPDGDGEPVKNFWDDAVYASVVGAARFPTLGTNVGVIGATELATWTDATLGKGYLALTGSRGTASGATATDIVVGKFLLDVDPGSIGTSTTLGFAGAKTVAGVAAEAANVVAPLTITLSAGGTPTTPTPIPDPATPTPIPDPATPDPGTPTTQGTVALSAGTADISGGVTLDVTVSGVTGNLTGLALDITYPADFEFEGFDFAEAVSANAGVAEGEEVAPGNAKVGFTIKSLTGYDANTALVVAKLRLRAKVGTAPAVYPVKITAGHFGLGVSGNSGVTLNDFATYTDGSAEVVGTIRPLGDVNKDGKVDLADAIEVTQYIANNRTFDAEQIVLAQFAKTGEGKPTVADVSALLIYDYKNNL